MAEMKTKVNEASVEEFLSTVEDEQKRKDCFEIVKIMKQVTKEETKCGDLPLSALAHIITSMKVGGKAICRRSDSPPVNRTSRSILG